MVRVLACRDRVCRLWYRGMGIAWITPASWFRTAPESDPMGFTVLMKIKGTAIERKPSSLSPTLPSEGALPSLVLTFQWSGGEALCGLQDRPSTAKRRITMSTTIADAKA